MDDILAFTLKYLAKKACQGQPVSLIFIEISVQKKKGSNIDTLSFCFR